MRHFVLRNFRGLEVYAEGTGLDRGSLLTAYGAHLLPRGSISSGFIWRDGTDGTALPAPGVSAFHKFTDYLNSAIPDIDNQYLFGRIAIPHTVEIATVSNKGAIFIAGDQDYPSRVWIVEPPHSREPVVDGLASSKLSYVDVIATGDAYDELTITGLTNYGPYIYAHHQYGVTALYDVETDQDPVTGFRVRQAHTPVQTPIANYNCDFGDCYLGYDGQIWADRIETGPPGKYESEFSEIRVPSYKSTGGIDQFLSDGWQDTAVGTWVPRLGLYVFVVDTEPVDNWAYDQAMFIYSRPNLTLTGPHAAGSKYDIYNPQGRIIDMANPQGTEYLFVKIEDGTYAYANLGEMRQFEFLADISQSAVTVPAGINNVNAGKANLVFNVEDLGDPNVHKSIEEIQLNFQYASSATVSAYITNEREQTSGASGKALANKERLKIFTNLNGRHFRLKVDIDGQNGLPWVLRDISIGYTPGVEL